MGKLKYFGTDGIRAEVGSELSPELIVDVAAACVAVCAPKKVVIGCDTRGSRDFITCILAGSFASFGVNVDIVGIVPTAALSYLTENLGADLGVMISASHNPFTYNGLKFFTASGEKIDEELTEEIDGQIGVARCEPARADVAGKIERKLDAVVSWQDYIAHMFEKRNMRSDIKIAVDCSFGSGGEVAEGVFGRLGCDAVFFNTEHDGFNINDGCGATCSEFLTGKMKGGDFAVGFAFDGDADRCVVFDEAGRPIDGDVLLLVLARHMKVSKVASTILFNLGIEKRLLESGIELVRTDVGDRFVYRAIVGNKLKLGGEGSGHVIFTDVWRSGDGLVTALEVLDMISSSGKKVSELFSGIELFPQVSENIEASTEQKKKIEKQIKIENGYKIIIRASGTENLVRVTVEGADLNECKRLCRESVDKVKQKIYN